MPVNWYSIKPANLKVDFLGFGRHLAQGSSSLRPLIFSNKVKLESFFGRKQSLDKMGT
jgi:hypothetical protein